MTQRGFGLVGNSSIGLIGAMLGGFLFLKFPFAPSLALLGAVLTASFGAVVMLLFVGMMKQAQMQSENDAY